jgi:predicted nucleic acid-binding Zn ribbon protein
MSDAALTECQKCGGALRRVIFPPAVVYKGSGFYVTDYKNGGRKSDSESSAPTGATAASSSDTKTETKTESKPEAKTETTTETKSST